jgi:hypothetical protein
LSAPKKDRRNGFRFGDVNKAKSVIAGKAKQSINNQQSNNPAEKQYDAFISYRDKADKRSAV